MVYVVQSWYCSYVMLVFCFFEYRGSTILWYPLQHLEVQRFTDGRGFLGTALQGLDLRGNLWNGTKCECVYVSTCMCVAAECVWKWKQGCTECSMNWWTGDKTVEAIFKVGMWKVTPLKWNTQRVPHSVAYQQAKPPVLSTEEHWRCLSGQLVRLCLHFPPDFFH